MNVQSPASVQIIPMDPTLQPGQPAFQPDPSDLDFETRTIARADQVPATADHEGGWEVEFDDGRGLWFGNSLPGIAAGIVPAVGDVARIYGAGCSRGVVLEGKGALYYRTPAQQAQLNREALAAQEARRKAEFERDRADLDRRYEALPLEFRRRIDRFRRNQPNFRWQNEAYEMFCCEQALELARDLKTPAAILRFHGLKSWDEQKAAWPNLSDQHSGNTLGFTITFALQWLRDRRLIPYEHGALCCLVGCDQYGCHPFTPEERQELEWLTQEWLRAHPRGEPTHSAPMLGLRR